ncbi:MAG: recombinase family protein [Firmicutes bacterium]|nr:recombinase family protein [Bacillota bacterium]
MKKREYYNVGIYCRLSKDDVGSGDSSSITTQKSMLEKYVHDNGWAVYDCYIDDGYSGTNFQRPNFERMIDDIEAGKINMVVVKDLSRLGRNYIMTGQYTDFYFPDRGVRFIALTDGIDTKNADNDIAPFRNILNEMYSRDLSKKIRSSMRAKKLKGEYVSNYTPIGYLKDPTNKNRLVVEEEGAAIVRRIYEMCANGNGSKKIAKVLNAEGVLSPINYRRLHRGHDVDIKGNFWHVESVAHVLRNRIYTGDMVQGIVECSQFRRTPAKRKPKEEWIITPNMHEPIIDRELWERVQICVSSRKRVTRDGEVQLFAGFLKCEDCGGSLSYSSSHGSENYTCGLYRRNGKNSKRGCTAHYIRKDTLEQVILDDIKRHAKLAVCDEKGFADKLLAMNDENQNHQLKALNTELKSVEARHSELDKIIKKLFENTVEGTLTDSRFQKLSVEYETEQTSLERRIEDIHNELDRLTQGREDSTAWAELIKDYCQIKNLDRIILTELIEKIVIGESRIVDGEKVTDITIYYRFVGAVGQLAA